MQGYICKVKDCLGKSFLLEYTYNGARPGIDEDIIKQTSNSSGIRDISRNLEISINFNTQQNPNIQDYVLLFALDWRR